MSEQAFQEKVKLTKEQMNEALEAQVDSTMNALMSDESFSEEQRGEVKVWLKQIYYLGKEHGKAEKVIDHIPEDAIDKMVGVFKKVAEATNPNAEKDERDYKSESMLYSLLYHQEQQISSAYKCQAFLLQEKLEGKFDTMNAFACCELRR